MRPGRDMGLMLGYVSSQKAATIRMAFFIDSDS
jgi:hypothetical protein